MQLTFREGIALPLNLEKDIGWSKDGNKKKEKANDKR
jgi:hypothetical protein